jgi:hypothetical protein
VAVEPLIWSPCGLAHACVHQPLSRPVPADDSAFRARKGTARLAWRTARRQWLLLLSGQRRWLRTRIDPAWRRALWIHEGMPQIGDALMDLAPRSLLVERGLAVDLFAAPHVAALFRDDAWFGRVLSTPADVMADAYDFAIVLSHDRKSLRLKRDRLAAMPWVSLQGFYGGPDFHRAQFAAQRLAALLGITLDEAALAVHSAQKLRLRDGDARWAAERVGEAPRVALALGGVHSERTYRRWSAVVEALAGCGIRQLLLVGAANGRELADRLVAAIAGRVPTLDLVGRTELRQAQALFALSDVAVCADGGLMHLALTTPAHVVGLFGAGIAPAWRLPLRCHGTSLVSLAAVEAIPPQDIARAVRQALGRHGF